MTNLEAMETGLRCLPWPTSPRGPSDRPGLHHNNRRQRCPKAIDSAKGWGGLAVNGGAGRSELSHCLIQDVKQKMWETPSGGVSFYNSRVNFDHVKFVNIVATDVVNLVHTDFSISNAAFKNTKSDALDVDFGMGKMTTSTFEEVGGDAIDLNGTKLIASDVSIDGAF